MIITTILVPTDLSLDSDAAFAYAIALARRLGASIHTLHVVEDPLASRLCSPGA